MSREVRIVVAGVPRGCQDEQPDGRWLQPHHLEQIKAAASEAEIIHTTRRELEDGLVPDPGPEILLIEVGADPWYVEEIPEPLFAKLVTPNLRWIQACSSGVTHILATGVVQPEHLLTNAAGVHADALGESTLAAVLMHAKRLRDRWENQQSRAWTPLQCDELRGKTMLVLGTGHIGTAAAQRAAAFNMRVLGIRRHPRPTSSFDWVGGPDDLHEMLRETDYLVIACPLTPETEGTIGERELALMPKGGYLINVSRGKVVQEPALLAALESSHLSGAFLDAHAEEPLPDGHPFWTAPGVTIIPHDSHSSPYMGDNIIELFCDNLRRYLAGEPLRNLVDPARGY